jgi:hypothetical protein
MKAAALIAFALLAATVPAHAQEDCLAKIRAAIKQSDWNNDPAIPESCWRFGPLNLGMTRAEAQTALGAPDASEPAEGMHLGRSYPAERALYVYPRDLAAQLACNPVRGAEFDPLALELVYSQDRLVALSVSDTHRTDYARCIAAEGKSGPPAAPVPFPYDFYGIRRGTPLSKLADVFGRSGNTNNSKDFWEYWPVPIAVGGEEQVGGLTIASSMTFASAAGGGIHFAADQDPATCRVRGFRVVTNR